MMPRHAAFISIGTLAASCVTATNPSRPHASEYKQTQLCVLTLRILHAEMPWQRRLIEEHAKRLPSPAPVVVQQGDNQLRLVCGDATFRVVPEESVRPFARGFRLELNEVDGGYSFEVSKERLNLPQPDGGDFQLSTEFIGFFFGTAIRSDGGWELCASCDPATGQPIQRPLVPE